MSVGLILAAGGSQRLGHPKQLLSFDGQPLICRTVDQVIAAGMQRIVVVLGAHAKQIEAALCEACRGEVEVICNDQWSNGQASSLCHGMRHLASWGPQWQQVVITLCDQPFVTASYLRTLNDALQDETLDVAATHYRAGGGVPAAIRRRRWQELIDSLSGDEGAKRWIRSLPPKCVKLADFPQAQADIDTVADLQRIASECRGNDRSYP